MIYVPTYRNPHDGIFNKTTNRWQGRHGLPLLHTTSRGVHPLESGWALLTVPRSPRLAGFGLWVEKRPRA